jgi:hypothetical protein
VTTKFNREDSKTCFRCDSNPPSFRLLSIQKTPTGNAHLETDCFIALICQSCLRPEIEDLRQGLALSSTPVGDDESPNRCLCRQVGFAIVPLLFSQRESELLIDELGTDCLEVTVN